MSHFEYTSPWKWSILEIEAFMGNHFYHTCENDFHQHYSKHFKVTTSFAVSLIASKANLAFQKPFQIKKEQFLEKHRPKCWREAGSPIKLDDSAITLLWAIPAANGWVSSRQAVLGRPAVRYMRIIDAKRAEDIGAQF